MCIAITEYRGVCVCSHEELVTGLAPSEVQLTRMFLKKLTFKIRLRSWSERLGPSGLPNLLVTNLLHNYPDLSCLSLFFHFDCERGNKRITRHSSSSYSFGAGAVAGILKFSNIRPPVGRRKIKVRLYVIISQK